MPRGTCPEADAAECLQPALSKARTAYQAVFGKAPTAEVQAIPGGRAHALVLAGWLWFFPAGVASRWVLRVVVPPGDAWFARHPCLGERHRYEIERPSFEEVLTFGFELEAHRLAHRAME